MGHDEPAGSIAPAQHGDLGPDAEISVITRWIEANLGAVEHIERMARWRPSWNANVRVKGVLRPIHVRGDRPGNWPPMPLSYECRVFELFGQCGVRTPRVHGFIEELPGIVMDRAPGQPDLATAANEQDRETVRLQLMEQMGLIHQVDPAAMQAIGAERPDDDTEAALSHFRLIEQLFTANRVAPAPGVEFVRRWINRNVPANPDGVCPVTIDAAQFLFEGDRLTAMLDFEFAGLGDFHSDLAALRIRNRAEYIGDVDQLIADYSRIHRRQIDYHRIRYHTVVIGVLTSLQVARELATGPAGIDYHEYKVWDAFCMLIALDCIAEINGWDRAMPDFDPDSGPSRQSKSLDVLAAALTAAAGDAELDRYQAERNARVVRYAERASRFQPDFEAAFLADAAALLGERPGDWCNAERLLEERVVREDPADEQHLLRIFTRHYARECFLLADPEDQTNYQQLTSRMAPLRPPG
jgi:hypothetical protein